MDLRGPLAAAIAAMLVGFPSMGIAQLRTEWTASRAVGSFADADARWRQLAGTDSLTSQLLRPLRQSNVADSGVVIRLFHPQTRIGYNRDVPWGFNDGAMWMGRGWSAALDAGLEAQWKALTVRIAPSMAWSQNREFGLAPLEFDSANASPFADQWWSSRIDRPQRFGTEAYSRISLGESVVRLDWRGVAIGAGTGSMWWGPGVDNTLLMSNHAEGIPHAFLGSSRPVRTVAGNLELMYLAGRLSDSDYWKVTSYPTRNRRWINGVAGVFEPRGAPGLFLGAARLFYEYLPEGGLGISDFLNILDPFQKEKLRSPDNPRGNDSTDQMLSIFARWAFPAVGFEVYGEWARNDHAADTRDFILEPDHATAFVLGFQKVFAGETGTLRLSGELTALAEGRTAEVRPAPTWYVHHIVNQGHTNRGQVMGAGIGPGSDMQRLGATWHRQRWHLGGRVLRLRNDSDGFYRFYSSLGNAAGNYLRHDVTTVVGIDGGLEVAAVRLRGTLQHGLQRNRYTVLGNDVHNIHVAVRAEVAPGALVGIP